MTETFTGYVTKYALTKGILELELMETGIPGMVEEVRPRFPIYYHGKDWWRTREDAVKQAERMREAKLKSLFKTIDKLNQLSFEASNGRS